MLMKMSMKIKKQEEQSWWWRRRTWPLAIEKKLSSSSSLHITKKNISTSFVVYYTWLNVQFSSQLAFIVAYHLRFCVHVCVCVRLYFPSWIVAFIFYFASLFVAICLCFLSMCVCVIRSSFDCFSCPRRYHHHHHRHYNNENEKGSLIHFIFCYKNHHIKQCKS